MTISEYIEALGRAELTAHLSVSSQCMTNYISDGRFPATKYRAVKLLADKKNFVCPFDLFGFYWPEHYAIFSETDLPQQAAE